MADQAEKLREMVSARVATSSRSAEDAFVEIEFPHTPVLPEPSGEDRRARVIAVTSGKGGVGKTNLTTALAMVLAARGQKVVVFDADLSLANVDVLLGLRPQFNLSHVIAGKKRAREIAVEGPRGLRIVPASSGIQELSELHPDELDLLIHEMAGLTADADTVFIDTAAGLSDNVLAFVEAADEVLVVTTPEPTAYTDAYAMLKVIADRDESADVGLIVNMALTRREAETAAAGVTLICKQFLNFTVRDMGWIPRDVEVAHSIRRQRSFVEHAPNCAASRAVRQLADKLLSRVPQPTQEGFWTRLGGYFKGRVRRR